MNDFTINYTQLVDNYNYTIVSCNHVETKVDHEVLRLYSHDVYVPRSAYASVVDKLISHCKCLLL